MEHNKKLLKQQVKNQLKGLELPRGPREFSQRLKERA
jgi:hypothetical protein